MFSKYVLILVWIGIMALVSQRQYRQEYDEITGENVWRVTPVFAFIVISPIVIMASTRELVADTYVYVKTYLEMPTTLVQIPTYFRSLEKDGAYYTIAAVIHCIFGNVYFFYLMIVALFQGFSLSRFFRRYSEDYVFSIFLFIASSDYISWMFNGIRQFTAVCILLFSIPYILKKDFKRVIIIIVIASFFHRSALIFLLIIPIILGEAWNLKTIVYLIAVMLAVVFVNRFTNVLDATLSGTVYKNVVAEYTASNDDGTNPLRVAVYCIPAVWSFFLRNSIRKENDPIVTMSTNMSIISMGLYIISMVTSGIFMGRLPIYFSLFGYILLPWEIRNTSNKNQIQSITVILYLLFYYYVIKYQFALI